MDLPEAKPEYDYRKRNHLLEAKKELYSLLICKNDSDLTDNEVDIMYSLSKDAQIKEYLNSKNE